MPLLLSYVLGLALRVVLVGAGLVFAAGLGVMFLVLLALWLLRALWARVTGKAVAPFIVRMRPREGFDRVFRHAGDPGSRTPRADAVRAGRGVGGVTDVDPK